MTQAQLTECIALNGYRRGPERDRMPLDETDVLLLKAVADIGKVEGAAAAVGLAPSTAVRRLGRLERRIEARLCRGDPDRLRLTAAGRTLLAAGLEFLGAVAVGVRRMSDAAPGVAPELPRLRIAGFGTHWTALVDELAGRLPGLLVEVHAAEPVAAAELYDRHRVDAVYAWEISGRRLSLGRPAEVRTVLDEPLWVALPATHPLAGSDRVPLRDLAAESWIAGQDEQATREAGRAAGFVPRIGHVVDSAPTARSMVSQGLGVALVSPLTVAPSAGAGLVLRPLTGAPHRRLVLAVDATVVGDRLARVLVRRLRAGYAATAAARNPDYRRSPDFPLPVMAPVDELEPDAGLLAGLRASTEPAVPAPRAGAIGLDDLHLLRVVDEAGSVNRAARILMISQPALSRRISRLERNLGTRLFVRSYRGTELAPAARVLLAEIDSAEANLRATLKSIVED
ncbi:MAG TPA: LysR family transcriptional regulator [Actinophytocola sp.]|uniref:LysR family transcriptional regulator n=1 Tax=Actinophytocola sp. TaxID=1872138 RepID=UPI002DDDA43B|nr:LysR family transcriptional regulator [Actinophytocola sp.]HEV2779180.1 LysR family transcriptional regulator [Actinophytocola sp.]